MPTSVKRLSSARRDNIWLHEVQKFLEYSFLREVKWEYQPLLGNFADKICCSSVKWVKNSNFFFDFV